MGYIKSAQAAVLFNLSGMCSQEKLQFVYEISFAHDASWTNGIWQPTKDILNVTHVSQWI